ncbi:hypothetical protein [Bradyrhizobium sp. BR 1433]|uniref:hypothetical protein n=1 Tax=Bradyrhizobium sp. BR 1433 TaxID=3447967 RepID=UPI003EE80943
MNDVSSTRSRPLMGRRSRSLDARDMMPDVLAAEELFKMNVATIGLGTAQFAYHLHAVDEEGRA